MLKTGLDDATLRGLVSVSAAPLVDFRQVPACHMPSLIVDLNDVAWKIVRQVPPDRIAVAESGMAGRTDVVRVAEAGADAVLIGTALSVDPTPERLLGELSAVRRHDR